MKSSGDTGMSVLAAPSFRSFLHHYRWHYYPSGATSPSPVYDRTAIFTSRWDQWKVPARRCDVSRWR
ncbi:hypothetical protein KCP75_21640 [Salmonella enterica subsp. enterica]|nr:hypothetical protein KCP75_21640 [Salmonella enterica subsp. enterica]